MSDKVRVGVIGVGNMGLGHINNFVKGASRRHRRR